MKNLTVAARNLIFKIGYKGILKRIYFMMDAEKVHDRMVAVGNFLGRHAFARILTGWFFGYADPALTQRILGLEFSNPVGLAAGFDKEAVLTDILPHVGFGFEEIGSITGKPCQGNPKPRLWRLKKSKSLLVYYGLKNGGCEQIAAKLKNKTFAIPLGVNVAKANSKETADDHNGIDDYVKAYRTFVEAGIGDYYTINISCPNAFGGEPFTDPERLDKLLSAIRTVSSGKPVFLKMPSELPFAVVDKIIEVAAKHGIDGFICTNLAKDRNNHNLADKNIPRNGGMSGKVVQNLSDELIKYIYKKAGKEFVIIGCGGVFTAEDAYKKIRLGASLIQLITGMIYEGPQAISSINLGLVKLLKRDGYANISQAIGADNK